MLSALVAVGANWYADLPDGLDTQLGDGARRLGAADAQQLALARLVLADPHVLILDEATAALDPTTARRTERVLAAVLSGRTVIAIAHRLNTAHDADRVAVLEDGRVTELGATTTSSAPMGHTPPSGTPGTADPQPGVSTPVRYSKTQWCRSSIWARASARLHGPLSPNARDLRLPSHTPTGLGSG